MHISRGQYEVEDIKIDQIFGIITAKVLPPRKIRFPALPYRVNGRLTFPLCRTCVEKMEQKPCQCPDENRALTGSWCSPEFQVYITAFGGSGRGFLDSIAKIISKYYYSFWRQRLGIFYTLCYIFQAALKQGYRVLMFHSAWHFPSEECDTTSLFAQYMCRFFALKTAKSGWPSYCKTNEDKEKYVAKINSQLGTSLIEDDFESNESVKFVAKILLNSLWGKLSENRANRGSNIYLTSSDIKRYYAILADKEKELTGFNIISDNLMSLSYKTSERNKPISYKTNEVNSL